MKKSSQKAPTGGLTRPRLLACSFESPRQGATRAPAFKPPDPVAELLPSPAPPAHGADLGAPLHSRVGRRFSSASPPTVTTALARTRWPPFARGRHLRGVVAQSGKVGGVLLRDARSARVCQVCECDGAVTCAPPGIGALVQKDGEPQLGPAQGLELAAEALEVEDLGATKRAAGPPE